MDVPTEFHQRPPVWTVTAYGTAAELKDMIRAGGVDVNAPGGPKMSTPLHVAIYAQDVAKFDILRYAGADLDAVIGFGGDAGLTPIELAWKYDKTHPDVHYMWLMLTAEPKNRIMREWIRSQRIRDKCNHAFNMGSLHRINGRHNDSLVQMFPRELLQRIHRHTNE
jgi:hypothetical protein